ncbi:Uncharacterized copper-binding protein, cupredoxin-like subfamily [Sulfitobacter brevis]|uniref:Uncharacterized copper-binding protein, cupredoxin-like subfamily n=1 Tax=Sulfitobacter brevis TaxID=74348 RepID=A0A1I1U970_9RHOB|nr:copper-binding protein [Sulfitobacter brevis]SFD67392.1 Uncharacterized copper-binding protein, cupredoxin-like subfamily [Sulfitobacter brevis]
MKNLLLTTTLALTLSAPAFAAGSHDGGHGDDHAMEMKIGMAGDAAKVDRTIEVTMRETDDGEMIFEPHDLEIKQGETIKFMIQNSGEIEHEFVLDTVEGNQEHKEAMAKMDMEHDDPNSIRLMEGGSGEIVWTFANAGTFEFACLIPGHYESGMHGPITVSANDHAAAEEPEAKVEVTAEAKAPAEYTSGKIKKVDTKAGKVTISHGPLLNLDMPAMTMVFRADEAIIAKLAEGKDIQFVAERVKGKLTVVAMK